MGDDVLWGSTYVCEGESGKACAHYALLGDWVVRERISDGTEDEGRYHA